ncbi:MAG: hypothetical protein WBM08_10155 [Prochlorococcaceae cyanobacterium]
MGRNRTGPEAWAAILMASLAMAVSTTAALAQATNPYGGKSTQEEQFLDYGPGNGKPKTIFDAKNPGDLINTLRKGAAMDDATPPGDAVDQALRALEAQNSPAPASGTQLKGP